MVKGFDFGLDEQGELIIDEETHDILAKTNNDLRLQLAYDRIKSVSTNWFIDHIGADLESLIGQPCNEQFAEYGKKMITQQLVSDRLWDEEEFFIKASIKSIMSIEYNVYFKIVDEQTEDTYSYEIIATLDLIKGVNIRYGWEPKKK